MDVNDVIFVLLMWSRKIIVVFLFMLCGHPANSQANKVMPPIPAMRVLHHQYIQQSLFAIARLKSPDDNVFPFTADYNLNHQIDSVVTNCITDQRAEIELNQQLNDNDRFKWLRGLNEMLTGYIMAYRLRTVMPLQLPVLVNAYKEAMHAEWVGQSIVPVVSANEPELGKILIENYALKNNAGIEEAKDLVVLKSCQRNPENILAILTNYPGCKYADSLIIRAAFLNQEELYSYAAVPNALGRRIQFNKHPLVNTIASLAKMPTGRMYFPFLDNLYHGITTIDSIAPIILNDSSEQYYKLLVKTRIAYVERMQHGDTPMAIQVLTNKLKSKGVEIYINEINALHDVMNENIRFRKIESLSPQELYYLAVTGEEEMYTSSFVSGIYPRIFQRMQHAASDSLLQLLHYDYYKKFIKLCASYNTLDDFLSKMDKAPAQQLMRNFVNGLDNTRTLEDAVDVANSYASISNEDTRNLILGQVQEKLRESKAKQNERGERMYHLLNLIFQSMDSTSRIDISERLGINPVYILPNQLLKDSAGRIVLQQFFYGDKGGMAVFNNFLQKFSNPNWKIIRKPQWVEVSSAKGIPITIYANLPLDEKKELDERSQDSLISYLSAKNIEPTIAIHRGHSYSLATTIEKLPYSAKLVILGSCGGYQSLHEVLETCPGANIIASKQIGTGLINQSLIDVICEILRQGKDLNWPTLWGNLEMKFTGSNKEKFDDYVPPYKNLGAIFIMAFNKAMMN
jgi:hypothetical protein